MTINGFVNIIRNFTGDHKSLKGNFYVGPNFVPSKAQRYPVLTMSIDPTTINEFTVLLKARIEVLDRVQTDGSDLLEVQNDTDLMCRDVIARLNDIEGVDMRLPVDINHYANELVNNDSVSGSYIDCVCEVFDPINPCAIPADSSATQSGVIIENQMGETLYELFPPQRLTIEQLQQIIQTLADPAPVTLIQTLT